LSVARTSERLVSYHNTTWRHITENLDLNLRIVCKFEENFTLTRRNDELVPDSATHIKKCLGRYIIQTRFTDVSKERHSMHTHMCTSLAKYTKNFCSIFLFYTAS